MVKAVYYELDRTLLVKINGIVQNSPITIQELCEIALKGNHVEVNNHPISLAVTEWKNQPCCVHHAKVKYGIK